MKEKAGTHVRSRGSHHVNRRVMINCTNPTPPDIFFGQAVALNEYKTDLDYGGRKRKERKPGRLFLFPDRRGYLRRIDLNIISL